MVDPTGFEPMATRLWAERSNQLSYGSLERLECDSEMNLIIKHIRKLMYNSDFLDEFLGGERVKLSLTISESVLIKSEELFENILALKTKV